MIILPHNRLIHNFESFTSFCTKLTIYNENSTMHGVFTTNTKSHKSKESIHFIHEPENIHVQSIKNNDKHNIHSIQCHKGDLT